MSRSISHAFQEAIIKDEVIPYLILKIGTADGDVNTWTGIGNLIFNPGGGDENFIGVGNLLGVSAVEETTELKSTGLNISLSGIPQTLISAALGSMRQGKTATLWLGLFDLKTSTIIFSPVEIFSGQTDIVTIDESDTTCRINIAIESRLVDLKKSHGRLYTPESQKLIDPKDLGFDMVSALSEKNIDFGKD